QKVRLARSLSKVFDALGFVRFDEEQQTDSDDFALARMTGTGRLNMLCLTSAKFGLSLSGPEFLVIRPYVHRMYFLCNKWELIKSMRQSEKRMRTSARIYLTGSGREFTHLEFTPPTINLNNCQLEQVLVEQSGVYLAKPACGRMGHQQQLVRIRPDCVQGDLLDFLRSSQFLEMNRSQVILQRYIERPLLVDKRKFDLRVYLLVVNARRYTVKGSKMSTGYFTFLHPGFLRLCTAPYNPDHPDLAVHLTNQSVQAKHTPDFGQLKEVTTWYPDELNEYLNRRHRLPRKRRALPKVGAILGYVSAVFRPKLDDRTSSLSNSFRIMGVDFLVDEQLRVYLLEFNSHPSWSRQTSVLNQLKPSLWLEAACLTSETLLRFQRRLPVRDAELVTRHNFRLIYSSEEPLLARKNVAKMYV
uniref:Tubulin--tyrosine ligase-like protein 9 n=1 Tax=Macrostomum lignano TaxID=282301 RepID=A0A1I8I2Z1_9PLAT